MIVDGTVETDGGFIITGGLAQDFLFGGEGDDEFDLTVGGDDHASGSGGNDHIIGGADNNAVSGDAGDDIIDLTTGGKDTAAGGGGNDVITFGATLRASDRINGGGDHDELQLDGDYSFGLTLASNTMRGIEVLQLSAGNDYRVVLDDGNVAADATLVVDGLLLSTDAADIDGSAETDGHFDFTGGSGNDRFAGGHRGDVFHGSDGRDTHEGGGGADTFDYALAAQSTSTDRDTIVGFDAQNCTFDVPFALDQVRASVSSGTLRNGSFDADLSAAIDAAHLGKHQAVLFTPDAGNLAGHTFLIVNFDNAKGYQANADLVVELVNAKHLGALDVDNFV